MSVFRKISARMVVAYTTLIVFLFPVYWFYATSLKSPAELDKFPPTLWPNEITWNVLTVLEKVNVGSYLWNSFTIATGITALTLALSIGASWALVRLKGPVIDVILFAIIILQMLPAALAATPLYVLFNTLYMLDTQISVILAACSKTIPFVIILLRPTFQKIPDAIIESARLDGCKGWRMLVFIVIPLVRNGIIVSAILVFMQSYGEFVFSRSFLLSSDKLPASVGLVTEFFGQFTRDIAGAMAFGTIYLTPILAVFVLVQRLLVSGLTAGAVK